MPIFLNTAGYKVYIWSNEKSEPVHFHIAKGNPSENDTKIWVLKDGTLKLAHNKGKIKPNDLTRVLIAMQPFVFEYIKFWNMHFDEVKFIESEN